MKNKINISLIFLIIMLLFIFNILNINVLNITKLNYAIVNTTSIAILAICLLFSINYYKKEIRIKEKQINEINNNKNEYKIYEDRFNQAVELLKLVYIEYNKIFQIDNNINFDSYNNYDVLNIIKEKMDPNKFNNMAKIDNFLKSIAEIFFKLPYLNNLLSHSISITENAATVLIDKYDKLLQEFNKIKINNEANIKKFNSQFGGKDMSCMINDSKASIENHKLIIEELSEINQKNIKKLDIIYDWLSKVDNDILRVNEISEKNKIIAINSSIEAARLGEKGKSFRILSNEIRNLNIQTNNITKDINKTMENFKKFNKNMISDWVKESDKVINDIKESCTNSAIMIQIITSSYEVLNDAYNESIAGLTAIENSLNKAIVSMQFQDIIRQQIDSVKNIICKITDDIYSHKDIIKISGYDLDKNCIDLKNKVKSDMINNARHYNKDIISQEFEEV